MIVLIGKGGVSTIFSEPFDDQQQIEAQLISTDTITSSKCNLLSSRYNLGNCSIDVKQ
jgi:hypothetical protein